MNNLYLLIYYNFDKHYLIVLNIDKDEFVNIMLMKLVDLLFISHYQLNLIHSYMFPLIF